MSLITRLKSTSTMAGEAAGTRLAKVLANGNEDQEKTVSATLEQKPFTFENLSRLLGELDEKGQKIDPAQYGANDNNVTPLSQQAFYDAVKEQRETAAVIQQQLEKLRAESKKQKGFLSKAFSVFASEKPLDKISNDVFAFDQYCREQKITFNEATGQLASLPEKENQAWKKIKDYRFLISAIAGTLTGLAGHAAGVDVLGTVNPALKQVPGIFFTGLPWLAVPFIGLNVFKAFSENGVMKQAETMMRFVGITLAGFAVSYGVTQGMPLLLDPVDPSLIPLANKDPSAGGGINPTAHILEVIGGFALLAGAYRIALSAKEKTGTGLKKAFNAAVSPVAPALLATGKGLQKTADAVSKGFTTYINYLGLPAVGLLMASTMNEGGLGQLAVYKNYYYTAFGGMLAGGALLAGGYYAYGCRKEEFKQVARAAFTGFSISSSTGTMPTEYETLDKMGVSKRTANAVIPLGGIFNMYGTSLYLGLTSFYALQMFNSNPSAADYAAVAATTFAIAFGTPGVPSSNIGLLAPVLQQTGLSPAEIQKVFTMVIPADRLLDMTQTGLNVMGDMFAAVGQDVRLKARRFNNMMHFRQERLNKEEKLPLPVPTAEPPAANMSGPSI